MRVHITSVFILFVALLFVSGTVGCRYSGNGSRYNPTSYSLVNPFDRDKQAPESHYASELKERAKPSQGALPNTKVSPPPGGFTDNRSALVSRADVPGGTARTTPPEHWSAQSHVASQNAQGIYSGYSNPEPSQYAPQQYQNYDGGSVPASYNYPGTTQPYPTQQYPAQNPYPGAVQPAGNTIPSNAVPTTYGAGQSYDGGSQYGYQPGMNNVPSDTFAANQPGAYNSNATAVPQPMSSPGYGYEPSSYPPAYPNGMTVASPYTPPPTPAGVYQ